MTNKKNYSSLSIAFALAAGGIVPQANAVDLGPVQIDGYIRQQMSMNLEDTVGPAGRMDGNGELSMNRTTLQLEWSADLPKDRSEEHTSELQSHHDLVCRLLLEKEKGTRNSGQAADVIGRVQGIISITVCKESGCS